MGAWGHKAFENDSAGDWVYELEEGGVETLRAALRGAAEAEEYLEVDEGSAAVAAAEIVAAASGGRERLSEEAATWLENNAKAITGADRELARRAVARVSAEESELRELWDENGDDTEWHAEMRELARRLA